MCTAWPVLGGDSPCALQSLAACSACTVVWLGVWLSVVLGNSLAFLHHVAHAPCSSVSTLTGMPLSCTHPVPEGAALHAGQHVVFCACQWRTLLQSAGLFACMHGGRPNPHGTSGAGTAALACHFTSRATVPAAEQCPPFFACHICPLMAQAVQHPTLCSLWAAGAQQLVSNSSSGSPVKG